MTRTIQRSAIVVLSCVVLAASLHAQPVDLSKFPPNLTQALADGRRYRDQVAPPTGRFGDAIQAFLLNDSTQPPTPHTIEFIGSSIFRQWTSVAEDMKPLPVYNRAFGGSRTSDVLERVGQIVLPYEPKVIVYYCGSNDINGHVPPQAILSQTAEFVEQVRATQPHTRIIYVSIIRAPQKKDMLSAVDSTNALMKEFFGTVAGCTFVDVNPALADAQGHPRPNFYQKDQLHLTPSAYVEMTRVIKPVVQRVWDEIRNPSPSHSEN